MACCSAAQEAVWLRRFLKHLKIIQNATTPVHIWVDSQAALAYAKDPKYHGKTKHIELKYHYVQQIIEKMKVKLQHISTDKMVVDPLTKPIKRELFHAHVEMFGLRRM